MHEDQTVELGKLNLLETCNERAAEKVHQRLDKYDTTTADAEEDSDGDTKCVWCAY